VVSLGCFNCFRNWGKLFALFYLDGSSRCGCDVLLSCPKDYFYLVVFAANQAMVKVDVCQSAVEHEP
jgi:hypothetical protein